MGWGALAVMATAAYLPRLDRVCGLFSDDGWYVLLARALALGKGYTLTNAPTQGIAPFYPPGFPVLLSFVFRVNPHFPDNVLALKSVSLAAMALVAVLTLHYCRTHQALPFGAAWAIALATVVHPAFVFLATSTVMSECVFTALQLATVLVVERAVRGSDTAAGIPASLLGGVLASFGYLTRTMGIALVLAGLARFLLRRCWMSALAFALAAGIVAGPWFLYARAHAPTPAEQAEENDAVLHGYTAAFWQRVAGYPRLGTVDVSDLPARIAGNALALTRSSMAALHVYFPFRTLEPAAWGRAPAWAHALGFAFSGLVVLGFVAAARRTLGMAEVLLPISFAITVSWPFAVTRFVLPLLPFVLCYTTRGVALVARWLSGRDRPLLAPAVVCGLAAVSMATNVSYAIALHGPPGARPRWNQIWEERLELHQWLSTHVLADQVVATYATAEIHLYCGLKTVGYYRTEGVFDSWRRLNVRFFVHSGYEPGIDSTLARFRPVYQTPKFTMRVLDLGPLYSPPS